MKEASPEWNSGFLPTLNSKGAMSVEAAERWHSFPFASAPGIISAKRAGLLLIFNISFPFNSGSSGIVCDYPHLPAKSQAGHYASWC